MALVRESDDPLGFRSAANRIAALMCSPITGRTTSVRHLSSFCWAARAASGARGQRIDRDLFDRAARVLTIAATGVLSEPGLALSPTQIRSLTLPGRRRATYVAQRVKSEQSRMDDFERPLLGSEHAQGLWGSYASLAGILGLVDSSKRYPVLTPRFHLMNECAVVNVTHMDPFLRFECANRFGAPPPATSARHVSRFESADQLDAVSYWRASDPHPNSVAVDVVAQLTGVWLKCAQSPA